MLKTPARPAHFSSCLPRPQDKGHNLRSGKFSRRRRFKLDGEWTTKRAIAGTIEKLPKSLLIVLELKEHPRF